MKNLTYAGKKACGECHSEELEILAQFEHKTLSCETCHGPGQAHAEDFGVAVRKPHDQLCVRCHEANPSRPKWFKQIVKNDHYDELCVDCHLPHQPNEAPEE